MHDDAHCWVMCIIGRERETYFYFRFVRPTDLESIPRTSTLTSIIPARFEVDMTIHCRVIAFLSHDTSRDLVTLWPWSLIFWPWTVAVHGGSRGQHCQLPPSLKTLRLSVLDLWVITFPVDYHWKCVRDHCACAESRDPCVVGQKQLHFWNAVSWFTYSLCTFGNSTMNIIKVICESTALSVLKNVWDSAHAQNHMICLRWPKCLIAVVLVYVDLLYWTWKVEHIMSFTAIFSNICTAHAQKRLFMNFRCKFRHHRSIRRPPRQ